MLNPEDALISRKHYRRDDGMVVIEEAWDTAHPYCPFMLFVGSGEDTPNPFERQVVMSRAQHAYWFGPRFDEFVS